MAKFSIGPWQDLALAVFHSATNGGRQPARHPRRLPSDLHPATSGRDAAQPADKDQGLAGKAKAFPAALMGLNPSQFCSCQRVAGCFQPAAPTCHHSPRPTSMVYSRDRPPMISKEGITGGGRSREATNRLLGFGPAGKLAPPGPRSHGRADTALGLSSFRLEDTRPVRWGEARILASAISLGKPPPASIRSWALWRTAGQAVAQAAVLAVPLDRRPFSVLRG